MFHISQATHCAVSVSRPCSNQLLAPL